MLYEYQKELTLNVAEDYDDEDLNAECSRGFLRRIIEVYISPPDGIGVVVVGGGSVRNPENEPSPYYMSRAENSRF